MTVSHRPPRPVVRAAVKIHEHLVGTAHRVELSHLHSYRWEQLVMTIDRLRTVQRNGWCAASRQLILDVDYTLHRMIRELEDFRTHLPVVPHPGRAASPGEIVADLAALATEFSDSRIELRERVISVRTAPIVLEGCYLGAFRIKLHWERIGREKAYEVKAVDPNPPASASDVTHPHVRDDLLCEGEGSAAIKTALRTGRLLDFFVLVQQVLHTYNPESAHVLLSHWGGVTCRDCGCGLDSDEQSECDRCHRALCSDCLALCPGCDGYLCSGCSGQCSECRANCCENCLTSPADCDRLLCPTCLNKKEESEDAEEELANARQAETPLPEIPPPTAPTDAVCLVEAAAPARPRTQRSRRVRRVRARRPAARRGRAAGAAAVQRRNR